MSVLILSSGSIGPFKYVETLSDRLRCDGTDYPFTVIGDYTLSDDDSLAPPAPITPKTRDQLKAERAVAVEAITVTTTAGNIFDGDETSQTRMARAVVALNHMLPVVATVPWVLADNSVIQATAAELSEALIMAGMAQASIWLIE